MLQRIPTIALLYPFITGTTALLLSAFSARQFTGSYGRALALLPPIVGLYAVAHGLLLASPSATVVSRTLEAIALSGLLVFVLLMLRIHPRVGVQQWREG